MVNVKTMNITHAVNKFPYVS